MIYNDENHKPHIDLMILPDDLLLSINIKYLPLYTSIQFASICQDSRRILSNITSYSFIVEKTSQLALSWELMYQTIRSTTDAFNEITIWALFMRLVADQDIAIRYPCFMVKVMAKLCLYSIIGSEEYKDKCHNVLKKYSRRLHSKGYELICIKNTESNLFTHIYAQYINATNCINEKPCLCHGFSCHREWNVLIDMGNQGPP